nr:VOC family protein [Thalassotalea atypica]
MSCNSIKKSVLFYTDIFGFSVNSDLGYNKGNIKLDVGNGTYIELFPFAMYQTKGRGCIAHFALRVDNLAMAIEHMESHGLDILRGPFTVRFLESTKVINKVAFYAGPDGEEIELIESLNS